MDTNLSIDERVEDLLSRMTDEEKVGQMLQVSYNMLSPEDYEKYQNLGIGSFLHVLGKDTEKYVKRLQTQDYQFLPFSELTLYMVTAF